MKTVKLISTHYIEKCGFSGINLINNNGESAEQAIHHLHIHIIPRNDNDNIFVFPKFQGAKYSIEDNFKKLKIN